MLEKAKVIYVTRNPRDVVLSYYNHWKIWDGYSVFRICFELLLVIYCTVLILDLYFLFVYFWPLDSVYMYMLSGLLYLLADMIPTLFSQYCTVYTVYSMVVDKAWLGACAANMSGGQTWN